MGHNELLAAIAGYLSGFDHNNMGRGELLSYMADYTMNGVTETPISGTATVAEDGRYYVAGLPGTSLAIPSTARVGFRCFYESGTAGTVGWTLPSNWVNRYGSPNTNSRGRGVLSSRGSRVMLEVFRPGEVMVIPFGGEGYAIPTAADFHITDIASLVTYCHAGYEHQYSNAAHVNDVTALERDYALSWGPRWGTQGFVYSPAISSDVRSYCPAYEAIDSVTGRAIYNMRISGGTQRGYLLNTRPTSGNFTIAISGRMQGTGVSGNLVTFSTVGGGAGTGGEEGLRYVNNTYGWQGISRNLVGYGTFTGSGVTETTNHYTLWAEWGTDGKFLCYLNGTLYTAAHASTITYVRPDFIRLLGGSSLSHKITAFMLLDGIVDAPTRTKAMAHLQLLAPNS